VEVHTTITLSVVTLGTVDLVVVLLGIATEVLELVELVQRGKETMEVEAVVNIILVVVVVPVSLGLIQPVNQTVVLEYRILSWELPTFGAEVVEVVDIPETVVMVVMGVAVEEQLELPRGVVD
jgi:hypothetical protein